MSHSQCKFALYAEISCSNIWRAKCKVGGGLVSGTVNFYLYSGKPYRIYSSLLCSSQLFSISPDIKGKGLGGGREDNKHVPFFFLIL